MTRDEEVRQRTVKRFLECEAKRAEARAAALAESKSEDEAGEIVHEKARKHWNEWAEDMLAKRKALEDTGSWAMSSLEPKNAETRAWMDEADADFSRCLFVLGGDQGQEAPGQDQEELQAGSLPVKSIALDGTASDFRGFIFPGTASFVSATFKGDASFASATFEGEARFGSATFTGEEPVQD